VPISMSRSDRFTLSVLLRPARLLGRLVDPFFRPQRAARAARQAAWRAEKAAASRKAR
jgi:hypothetical protein